MPTITADKVLLTTDDYHRMIEAGILTENDRVELIDGQIVPMAAVGTPHLNCVNELTYLFVRNVGEDVEVSIQNPVQLGPHQEPEPDVALLRRGRDRSRTPTAADVLLLVEVSDTTLRKDRDVKRPRYAEAGIPAYWIINLEDAGAIQIDVYTQPAADGYAEHAVYHADDQITLPHADLAIRPRDLLP